jgi:hypothetical protein
MFWIKHFRMLDTLIERAMNTRCLVDFSNLGNWLDPTFNMDVDMSVLLVLSEENFLVLTIVMNLMRQVACQVMTEQADLSGQVRAVQDDNARLKEERETEAARFEQEKELLEKRVSESEATCSHLRVISSICISYYLNVYIKHARSSICICIYKTRARTHTL